MATSDFLGKLPESLKIGFSSSSYQIEGAWDADGKSKIIIRKEKYSKFIPF